MAYASKVNMIYFRIPVKAARARVNSTCQAGFGDQGYRCVFVHRDTMEIYVNWSVHPSGFAFQGSCYARFTGVKNWDDAKAFCVANGAQLVKIDSSDENDFIKNTFLTDKVAYWIGLTDAETEGVWKWSDGSVAGYTTG
ncbi:mannose binding [Desmophyllum pertusum]|uniref:Mannose binding n=1 Tax=Desmophyllum pertusum TaxID=174260 RepID=A0A9W9YVT9_9CNID|nr:mannose binding [Desmophyllum pertusum]